MTLDTKAIRARFTKAHLNWLETGAHWDDYVPPEDVVALCDQVEALELVLRFVAAQTSPDMAMIECARIARATLSDADSSATVAPGTTRSTT